MGRSCRCWRCQASRWSRACSRPAWRALRMASPRPSCSSLGVTYPTPAWSRTALYFARVAASSARSVAGSRIASRCGYSALTTPVEAFDPGLVGGGVWPAEVLGDRAQGEELPGRAGGHLRPVVGDGEQDRAGLILHGEVDPAVVVAGFDPRQQTLGLQGGGETQLDLGAGLLHGDDLGEPLTGDQVLDDEHRHPGRREVRRIVDPDRVRGVLDPVGEQLANRPARTR